jgi:acyl carrier protein
MYQEKRSRPKISNAPLPDPLRERVADAVRRYLAERLAALGKPIDTLVTSADLFAAGVLDSLALAALIAAVERDAACEIDFIDVDPDALGTVDGIVGELSGAAAPR